MSEAPPILLDRMTGQSGDNEELEVGLSFDRRFNLYVGAENSLLMAEAAADQGYSETDADGERTNVEDAIRILEASARYRAAEITAQELIEAKAEGTYDDAELAMLEARHNEQKQAKDGPDYLQLYRDQSTASERSKEADKDIDIAED